MTDGPVVFVVDDDTSVRSSVKFLVSSVGLQVEDSTQLRLSCGESSQAGPAALYWMSGYAG